MLSQAVEPASGPPPTPPEWTSGKPLNTLEIRVDDPDYMHARYCDPLAGRFLSVDPVETGVTGQPLSWNKYTYSRNNPVKYADPDGEAPVVVSQEQLNENHAIRTGVSAALRTGPTAGRSLAGFLVDSLLAEFFPISIDEYHANAQGAVVNMGASVLSSRLTSAGARLQRIFTKNLTPETVEAAARESLGEVVATKRFGAAFDHVTKYERARAGATRAIGRLKNLASDTRLGEAERATARRLISRYSKRLDRLEELYEVTRRRSSQ